jgi:hypothetical protein
MLYAQEEISILDCRAVNNRYCQLLDLHHQVTEVNEVLKLKSNKKKSMQSIMIYVDEHSHNISMKIQTGTGTMWIIYEEFGKQEILWKAYCHQKCVSSLQVTDQQIQLSENYNIDGKRWLYYQDDVSDILKRAYGVRMESKDVRCEFNCQRNHKLGCKAKNNRSS